MATARINQFDTTCIHIDIPCDASPERGATSGNEVAYILIKLAAQFLEGNNPMNYNASSVAGVSVDYL